MDFRGFDEIQRALWVHRAPWVNALGALVVTWGLVACGPGIPLRGQPQTVDEQKGTPTATVESPPEEETMTPTPEPAEVTPPVSPPQVPGPEAKTGTPAGPGAERVVQLARQDLAQKQGLPIETIRVVSVEAVEWPDTSLGCPQPGMMYAQVITPGFRVVLAAKDQTYEYHTGMDRSVVLCAK